MVNRLETQISATDKTKRAFASFNSSMERSRRRMQGLSVALGGFLSLAGAIRLGQLTNDAVKFGSEIAIASDKIGVSADSLQALRLAGEQFSNVQSSTVDMALQRFSRRLGEADQGTGELKDTLIQLGISTRNADGSVKSVEQALFEYADAIKMAESDQRQLQLSFKGFDSEGAVLVTTLKQGSEALKRLMMQSQQTGAVMSGTMSAKAKELNEAFRLQTSIINTQLKEAFISLAPIVVGVLKVVGDVARQVNNIFKSDLDKFKETLEGDTLNTLLEKQKQLTEETQKRIELEKTFGGMFRQEGFVSKEMKHLLEKEKIIKNAIELQKKQTSGSINQANGVNHLVNAFKNLNNQQTLVQKQAKQFATKFQTGLVQAFDNVIDGTKSVGDSLKELGKQLIREAIRMFIFRNIIAPFTGSIGLGGLLGKLPGFANGGYVSKNKPVMVGERGAEVFVPNQSGHIIPNHKVGGGGVVINQNINFATGVQATVRNEVLQMLPLISQASIGAVSEARRRGVTS